MYLSNSGTGLKTDSNHYLHSKIKKLEGELLENREQLKEIQGKTDCEAWLWSFKKYDTFVSRLVSTKGCKNTHSLFFLSIVNLVKLKLLSGCSF